MTALASVSTGSPPPAQASLGAAPSTTLGTLPAPDTSIDSIQDMLAKVFALMSAMQSEQSKGAMTQVSVHRTARQSIQHQRDEALARAKREAEKGGIFGWVTKDIGLLGVVGLATFNYGLVAADVAMHKTGLVHNVKVDVADGVAAWAAQAHPELLVADILLRKLDLAPDAVKKQLDELGLGPSTPGISDEDVKPVVDTAVKINLIVAGAAASVLSAGSATALVVALIGVAMSAGAYASSEAGGPAWLTLGLQLSGAALTIGAGIETAGVTTLTAAQAARVAAAETPPTAVNAASTGIGGADTMIHAVHQRNVDDATLTATRARHAIAKLERLLDDLLDALEAGKDSQKRISNIVVGALDTYDSSLLSTSAAIKA